MAKEKAKAIIEMTPAEINELNVKAREIVLKITLAQAVVLNWIADAPPEHGVIGLKIYQALVDARA